MKKDMVNHPSHYTFGSIEVIDYLMDRFPFNPLLFQVGKYIARLGKKDDYEQDLEKSQWYYMKYLSSKASYKPLGDYRLISFEDLLKDWGPSLNDFQISMLRALEKLYSEKNFEENKEAICLLFKSELSRLSRNFTLRKILRKIRKPFVFSLSQIFRG